jgi:hypothetical protein
MVYNEESKIQYLINFYRKRFSSCKFVIYDNYSTDNTNKILKDNNCEIIMYNSNNQINDISLRNLKNLCWKSNNNNNWILICDADEMLDITEEELKSEEKNGVTIIRSEGWNMVNMENNYNLDNIKYGFRDKSYDKYYLFNKKYIKDMNYSVGAHSAVPNGKTKFSSKAYKLYHYSYINPDLMVSKYQLTAKRLSDVNKKYGMGSYCLITESEIRRNFENARKIAQKIRE